MKYEILKSSCRVCLCYQCDSAHFAPSVPHLHRGKPGRSHALPLYVSGRIYHCLACLILSVTLFVLRSNEARLLAGFIIALLGIIIVILPQAWAIGICPPGMGSCHKTTFFVTIAAGLLTIAGAWIVFLHRRGDQEVL